MLFKKYTPVTLLLLAAYLAAAAKTETSCPVVIGPLYSIGLNRTMQFQNYTPMTLLPLATSLAAATETASYNEIADSFEDGLHSPWKTSPEHPWTIDETDGRDGAASVRSAPIVAGQTSDLYVTVKSDYGGTAFFSIKSDVQMPRSGFYVNVGDKTPLGYTFGFSEWRDVSIPVEPGQHVITFRTEATSYTSSLAKSTSGTVNIDMFSFQPHLYESFESRKLPSSAQFVDNDWLFDTSNPHAGSDVSLRSPSLESGQTATMQYDVSSSPRGSIVEFWFDSNVQGGDTMEFLINDHLVLKVIDPTDIWRLKSKMLPPGEHKLEWRFTKSGDADSTVWIDDIRIRPIGGTK